MPAFKAGADFEGEPLTLLDILIIFAKRKRSIAGIALAFAIIATIASFILPKSYTATETFLVPSRDSTWEQLLRFQFGDYSGMEAQTNPAFGLAYPEELYASMLSSGTVEDVIVRRFELMREYHDRYFSDAKRTLEQHVMVDGDGHDGLLRIAVEDRDPVRAAQIADTYVAEFQQLYRQLIVTSASRRRRVFEQQLEQARAALTAADQRLRNAEQTTGLITPDGQTQALIESAASIRAQLVAEEALVSALAISATVDNPQRIRAEKELQSLQDQLAGLENGGHADGDELMIPGEEIPTAETEYSRAVRNEKYYETVVNLLGLQFELAKLDEAKQGTLIQVLDSAVPPRKPSFPEPIEFAIGGAIAGIFAGIGWAIAAYHLDRSSTRLATRAKFVFLRRALGKSFAFGSRAKA